MSNNKDKQQLWNTFEDKPASSVMPKRDEEVELPDINNIFEQQVKIYKHHNVFQRLFLRNIAIHK